MKLSGDKVGEVWVYLGSFLQNDGGFEEDMKHRIKRNWCNREKRQVFCVVKGSQ